MHEEKGDVLLKLGEVEKEMKTAENKLLGSSQMLRVSIETPHTSHSSLFSLHFFIYFVVSSSRIT